MLRALVEKLGRPALLGGIKPLAKPQESHEPFVGWDTEYDSKTRRLLCYQLWGPNGGEIFYNKLTVESLVGSVAKVLGNASYPAASLVTFWSYAELQFLPTVRRSYDWRIYGTGSLDCSFRHDSTELRVFDLARFFERSSLAKVAESFGLRKLEYDTKRVTRRSLKDPRFLEYALHDAFLAYEIMRRLRAEFLPYGADPLVSKTAAGLSATVFRRRISVAYATKVPKARLAGLYSCWGGRAEALQRGKFPAVYEYDLASAYPRAAMAIRYFPSGDNLEEKKSLRGLLEGSIAGFGRVIFSHPPSVQYPALPVVTADAQIYPRKGVSWATSFEIKRALALGAEIELLEGWGYRDGSSELSDMMAWALQMRKEHSGARAVAAKLLANSLIGKFAQRRASIDLEELREWCEENAISIYDAIHLTKAELAAVGIHPKIKVGACFMPEWNTLITGYTRARLHEILCSATPVYCATDSVWSLSPLTDPPADLDLKRKGPGIVVRTRFGAIETEKGLHLAHHSIWRRDAGFRIARDLDTPRRTRYYVKRPIKLRESIRRKMQLGVFVKELRYGDASWDGKRRLFSDGTTAPWDTVDEFLTWRKENGKAKDSARNRDKG